MSTLYNFPNSATLLIPAAQGARQSLPCTFDGMEGKRIEVTAEERVAGSAPVSIQYNDAMFLGEVLICTQNSNGTWHMEIRVEQILTGLQSLMNLRARLLGEAVPEMSHATVGR